MVLDFLIIPARQAQEVEWNEVMRCAEHRCSERDHYAPQKIAELEDEAREAVFPSFGLSEGEESVDDVQDEINAYVVELVSID